MSLIPRPNSLVPQPVNADQLPKSQDDIREIIGRSDAALHQQREAEATANPAEILNRLVRGVTSASIEKIDGVILELESARDMLCSEGERVNREIAGFANLNDAAMSAMQVIGASSKHWKDASGVK